MPGGRTRKGDVRNSGIQCSSQDVPMSGGTVRPPTRAGGTRTSSAGRSARGARNKKRTVSAAQTARFNLPTSAFIGASAIVRVRRKERPSPPLPQKAGAEGWGIPLGRVLPPRRASLFRLLFPSSGKVDPAEQNKQKIIANKTACDAKSQTLPTRGERKTNNYCF